MTEQESRDIAREVRASWVADKLHEAYKTARLASNVALVLTALPALIALIAWLQGDAGGARGMAIAAGAMVVVTIVLAAVVDYFEKLQ
jgi:Mg2+/Co2+ transporter CorB